MAQDIVQHHYDAIMAGAADYLEGRTDPKTADDKLQAEVNAARLDGTLPNVLLEMEKHNGVFNRHPHVIFLSEGGDDKSEGATGFYIDRGRFEKTDGISRRVEVELTPTNWPPEVHAEESKGLQFTDPIADARQRSKDREDHVEYEQDKARFKPGEDIAPPLGGDEAEMYRLELSGQAKNVRRLQMNFAHLDNVALHGLKSFTHLSELSLNNADDVKDIISSLKDVPSLEKLSLEFNELTATDLQKLAALPNLKELDTEGANYSDQDVIALKNSPKLEKLAVGFDITDKGLANIAQIRTLTDLQLSGNRNVTEAGVIEFLKTHPLKHLDINLTNVHMNVLQKQFPNLQISGSASQDRLIDKDLETHRRT